MQIVFFLFRFAVYMMVMMMMLRVFESEHGFRCGVKWNANCKLFHSWIHAVLHCVSVSMCASWQKFQKYFRGNEGRDRLSLCLCLCLMGRKKDFMINFSIIFSNTLFQWEFVCLLIFNLHIIQPLNLFICIPSFEMYTESILISK